MLRDRLPKQVDLALRFCKAKEAWLNHVYKNFIWMYSSKKERHEATRNVLGLNTNQPMSFHNTIDWNNLSDEDKIKWAKIETIVIWFQTRYLYAKNSYDMSKRNGTSWVNLKYALMKDYLSTFCPKSTDDENTKEQKNKFVNKFADFVLDSFEGNV